MNLKKISKKKLNLKKSKKKLNFINRSRRQEFKKAIYFFNVLRKPSVYPYIWEIQWKNLHHQYQSLLVNKIVNKFLSNHGLYINTWHIHIHHNNLKILGTSLGVFRKYKIKQKSKESIKLLKNKVPLSDLGKILIQINKVTQVKLNLYNMYLPKKLVQENSTRIFKKYKNERFFWESLQLIYGLFRGYVSANILANLMYIHTRRNPRRVRFIAYIKLILDWHFKTVVNSKIQGVRIEIKGRFNAKSRAKKRIISVGRVRMHEKTSNVSYAYTDAITKFGSLGIKVWVCPL